MSPLIILQKFTHSLPQVNPIKEIHRKQNE